jgi:hypothetical protein
MAEWDVLLLDEVRVQGLAAEPFSRVCRLQLIWTFLSVTIF